ncbi:uncharacterized protein VTP21DRAFT_981 [Calcarisporiella thermophila]|uniref:uncharacterized protein n=1 Tax=Calcarisporiella thermophila TaxID=911321 RepID=UPI00374324F8
MLSLLETNYKDHAPESAQPLPESILKEIPFVELTVRSEAPHLFEDSAKVVLAFFPSWRPEELDFYQCKDGITNKLVKVTRKETGECVLVRAYGRNSEIIIDRGQEIMNIVCLSNLELAPPLFGRFKNGLVYGYIPGRIFSVDDMAEAQKSALVARRLAQWHKVKLPIERQSRLFSTLYKWLKEVPTEFADGKRDAILKKHFTPNRLIEEVKFLEQALAKFNSPVVFCHNDLLHANIIYTESDDVAFIDMEYASYSFRGFDIGNHFNEYAGFDCDYSRYPSKETQLLWLSQYLSAYHPDQAVDMKELEELYAEVDAFSLASHLYWCLWALAQAKISDIDFDYLGYAVLRFNEYLRRKAEVF